MQLQDHTTPSIKGIPPQISPRAQLQLINSIRAQARDRSLTLGTCYRDGKRAGAAPAAPTSPEQITQPC